MIAFKLGIFLVSFLLAGMYFSCKTVKPENPPVQSLPAARAGIPSPRARLVFERAEAETIECISLYFTLEVTNPRAASADLNIQDWRIQLNKRPLHEGSSLILDAKTPRVSAGAEAQFPVRLNLDMNRFSRPDEETGAEYLAELQMRLSFAFASGDTAVTQLDTEAVFPRIREPELSITSIAVGKGERVSAASRFRLSLQVDNPNIFPLEVSAFSYSLYGDGVFWAEGEQNETLHVPANGSAETYVYCMIDFIEVKQLQKQLAALKQVQYRLTGETTILTNIVYLPEFRMGFDLSGDSRMR
ncbi:MAG: LEA type 2 family protein [Spirochaetaceae bacterium]|jgi:LEA14-like dessication related protein|nr:LEA type 2 family protein [Spirochaetaceae bacterium]